MQAQGDDESFRLSSARYKSLFEHSPNCVHEVDSDRCIRATNSAGLQLLGFTAMSVMIGMPYLQLVCAQDRDTVAGLIDRAFDGEAVNCTFTAANGMLCQSSFVSIADEQGGITNLLVLTQDVTDHQVRAATLSELQKRNALILESAGEGIYGLDADGQITFGNDAAARIVGWRTENVIGQKIARRPSPLTRQWLKLPPR